MIYVAGITGKETDAECEQIAFDAFATLHPHEAHATEPDRFWSFFQKHRPGITRDEMVRVLAETSCDPNNRSSVPPPAAGGG